jgi:hypothetical protein
VLTERALPRRIKFELLEMVFELCFDSRHSPRTNIDVSGVLIKCLLTGCSEELKVHMVWRKNFILSALVTQVSWGRLTMGAGRIACDKERRCE